MLYPEVLARSLRDIAADYELTASAAEEKTFGASVEHWPAFPDSAEALAYLKGHYKLVILSNIDRASFAHSNAKLGVDFDLVITAQDVGSYKRARPISSAPSRSSINSACRNRRSCTPPKACSTTTCRPRTASP